MVTWCLLRGAEKGTRRNWDGFYEPSGNSNQTPNCCAGDTAISLVLGFTTDGATRTAGVALRWCYSSLLSVSKEKKNMICWLLEGPCCITSHQNYEIWDCSVLQKLHQGLWLLSEGLIPGPSWQHRKTSCWAFAVTSRADACPHITPSLMHRQPRWISMPIQMRLHCVVRAGDCTCRRALRDLHPQGFWGTLRHMPVLQAAVRLQLPRTHRAGVSSTKTRQVSSVAMATPTVRADRIDPRVPTLGVGLAVGTNALARRYEAVDENTPIATKGPGL